MHQTGFFLVIAYCLFAYETFDALDGQQGKRVGMYTNATTELFDHGSDAITTTISAITFCHIFHIIESPPLTFIFMLNVFTTFYFHTWEHTSTGVMTFRFSGNPTEGLFCSIAFLIVTGIFGNQIWLYKFGDLFPIFSNTWMISQLKLNQIGVGMLALSAIVTAKSNITSVFKHAKQLDNSKNLMTRNSFTITRCLELLPFLCLVIFAYNIIGSEIFLKYPRMTLFLLGFQWNLMVMRLIISEITKQPYDWHKCLSDMIFGIPFLFFELDSNFFGFYYLLISLIIYLGQYFYMIHFFCSEMCHILSMKHWWSLPKQPLKSSE